MAHVTRRISAGHTGAARHRWALGGKRRQGDLRACQV